MLVLSANKSKMMRLVKARGYTPPSNARFIKAYRARTWWLEWEDGNGFYQASFSTAAGRAFLGVRYREYDHPEKWNAQTLTLEELKEFDLVKELPSQQSPPQKLAERVASVKAETQSAPPVPKKLPTLER